MGERSCFDGFPKRWKWWTKTKTTNLSRLWHVEKFTVIANLVSKQVDVTWTPSEFFKDRTPIEGHFDHMKIAAIQDLLDAAEST